MLSSITTLLFASSSLASLISHDIAREFIGDVIPLSGRAAAAAPSTNLPGPWSYQGCYTDAGTRTLSGNSYTNTTGMTVESCIAFCEPGYWIYAGVEYFQECCTVTCGLYSECVY